MIVSVGSRINTRNYTYPLHEMIGREPRMAHKTLTISEEAYNALVKQRKTADESFTRVILRLANNGEDDSAQRLLDYIRSMPADHDFADRLREVVEERKTIKLRTFRR